LAASRLDPAAAVVCGRGARVDACAQAPPDYRSAAMLCWWSRPGGRRCGSMPGHFPVLAQTRTKSQRSSTIAFEKGFQFNWYSPPSVQGPNPFPKPLVTQAIGISARRLLLCDYIASLLASISSTLRWGVPSHGPFHRSPFGDGKVDRCFTISFRGKQIVGLWSIIQDLGERLDDLAKQDKQVAGTLSLLTGSMIWNINTRSIYSEWARELWRYES
jgi:hypothetical protein